MFPHTKVDPSPLPQEFVPPPPHAPLDLERQLVNGIADLPERHGEGLAALGTNGGNAAKKAGLLKELKEATVTLQALQGLGGDDSLLLPAAAGLSRSHDAGDARRKGEDTPFDEFP